ncbi:hypothetical protein [Legionella yabuuchiae]|uniref:hypothetical protein n=1 Tax=Legionella yabuuchiae TaxID=376727 RepID=UPI001055DEF9|nr:hypothetical protein [Legionella yabuuchiae]
MEKKFHREQRDADRHRQYWFNVFKEYQPLIIAASIPLVYLFIRATGKKANLQQAKRYARYLILTIIASIQSKVLSSLVNKAF